MACYNAIKMDETIGKTYELGGPHIYTEKQLFEIMMNITKIPT